MVRAIRAAFGTTLLLLAASSLSAQTTELLFVNRTGTTIYFLYASASNSETWGQDLLGRTVFPNEGVFRARLRSDSASFDVRAVDANDNEYIIWGWRPARESRVVLTTDAFVGLRTATSDSAVSWVTVVNHTNYDVREILVSPADGGDPDAWEPALSPGETLHFREDLRLRVDVDRHDSFVYDIMLVDVDGDRYVKRGVNLELTTEIVFTLDDLDRR